MVEPMIVGKVYVVSQLTPLSRTGKNRYWSTKSYDLVPLAEATRIIDISIAQAIADTLSNSTGYLYYVGHNNIDENGVEF
jgi:hypothetical protein